VPSRDNKPRGGVAVSPAADREARPGAESAVPPQQAARTSSRQDARTTATSRRALRNWRVRSRLLLLITIPTLTAVVLGGTRIVTSVQSALSYQRIEQLANLSSAVTGLAGKMEDERDQTVVYIADNSGGRAASLAGQKKSAADQLQLVQQQYSFTQPWVGRVRTEVAGIGSTYPAQVRQDAAAIRSVLRDLPNLREAAINTQLPALVVVSQYTAAINSLVAVDDDIALDSGDPVLASSVRALGVISRIEEEASEQRAMLAFAFTQERFGSGVLPALTTAQAQMNDNIGEFTDSATPAQSALYQNNVSGSLVDLADQYEQQAIAYGQSNRSLGSSATTEEEWFGAMSGKIGAMRKVEQNLVDGAVGRAGDLRRSAIIDSIVIGAAIIIVLGLALVLTTLVGRSMVRPLRRLRAGALEVAGLQLPETVRRMSESDGSGVPLAVAPIDVDSTDEIGEVARAFDQVHREALRLASNEAALRGNVNAMFVNLSRRSQSLVERQIRLIDDLEQGEQDAERLSSLFQMDHLATRMRRNSENLLVLAGHDSSRRWNQPVALVDVLRAAVSEIEQYERVSLNVQPGISVRGHAVNDAVHLLAELAENATSFSSAETPVTISGHLLSSGGVLLDITDQGVGMGAEEMAHANWRLDNPPVVDVAVSRRMGLFVVARLAARHGVRVRLRPAASGGLTALVWLPDEVVSREASTSPSGTRMPELPGDLGGLSMPGVSGINGHPGTDERSATAQEVDAARTPKFASLEAAADGDGGLGRRVPGSGPRPGADPRAPATGPLPAFRTSPQPADGGDIEPFETSPQAVGADAFTGGPQHALDDRGAGDSAVGGAAVGGAAVGGAAVGGAAGGGAAVGGPPINGVAGAGSTGTGPIPAVGRDGFNSWPEAPDATSAGNGQKLPKRDPSASRGATSQARSSGIDLFGNGTGSSQASASGGSLFGASPGTGQASGPGDSPAGGGGARHAAGDSPFGADPDRTASGSAFGADADADRASDGNAPGSNALGGSALGGDALGGSALGSSALGGHAPGGTGWAPSGDRDGGSDQTAGSDRVPGSSWAAGSNVWGGGSDKTSEIRAFGADSGPEPESAEPQQSPAPPPAPAAEPPAQQDASAAPDEPGLPSDAPEERSQWPEPVGAGSRPVFSAPVDTLVNRSSNGGTNGGAANGGTSHGGASHGDASHGDAPNGGGTNGGGTNGGALAGDGGFTDWETPASADEVIVPPAEQATEYRLPIFEAVESDWFRRGRSSVGWAPPEAGGESAKSSWASPADEGWQAAAAAVSEPSSAGTTPAGLPKRVPQANLVPGTAGAEPSAPAPARSAAVTRDRFASFQRGIREGRAAVVEDSEAGEDDGSR
jgi:signal transduction histidine kinase